MKLIRLKLKKPLPWWRFRARLKVYNWFRTVEKEVTGELGIFPEVTVRTTLPEKTWRNIKLGGNDERT